MVARLGTLSYAAPMVGERKGWSWGALIRRALAEDHAAICARGVSAAASHRGLAELMRRSAAELRGAGTGEVGPA